LHLTPAARSALQARTWPGNIRELANTLDVAVLLADSAVIDAPDLPDPPLSHQPAPERLSDVLAACGGNMSRAARRLGVNRSTILRRARREGVVP
jgi:transcriptional regulator of acetoin/glycerol metabolism